MSKSTAITVNSTAYTAVIPTQATTKITLNEDLGVSGWPTTDFYVVRFLTDTPKRIAAGMTYDFDVSGFWHAGETAGYIKTVTGSTTFVQDEQWS